MEPAEISLSAIRVAATRGARTVTLDRQVVRDATAQAIERWEDALLADKSVDKWESWAFRVAFNAAKRILSKRKSQRGRELPLLHEIGFDSQDESFADLGSKVETARRHLNALVKARSEFLRGRQLEVLLKLTQPGMSLHRAAKELGMTRHNVRRSLRSAIARLRSARK